jgi:hypothetical protein
MADESTSAKCDGLRRKRHTSFSKPQTSLSGWATRLVSPHGQSNDEVADGVYQSRAQTLLKIKMTLEAGGIEFVGTPSIARHPKWIRVNSNLCVCAQELSVASRVSRTSPQLFS